MSDWADKIKLKTFPQPAFVSKLQRMKALQMLAAFFLEFKRNKETSSLDFVQVASFCWEKSNGP